MLITTSLYVHLELPFKRQPHISNCLRGFSSWTSSKYFKFNMSKNELPIILPKPASSTVFPISVREFLYFQLFLPKILRSFFFLRIHSVNKIYLPHQRYPGPKHVSPVTITAVVQDIKLVWIMAIISQLVFPTSPRFTLPFIQTQ